MCVRTAEGMLRTSPGVTSWSPRHFSRLLPGAGGRGDFPRLSRGSVGAETSHEVPGCANYGGEHELYNQRAQVSKCRIRFVGTTEQAPSVRCQSARGSALICREEWGNGWPGARPGLPEDLRSFLIPLPTSRLRRELPPLSHDSFVTRPKRRHLSGCSLLSCDGRDSVSASRRGRSWVFMVFPRTDGLF